MKNNKILLILCPPVWEKLPPPGIAYLSEYLKMYGYQVFIYDLNILFFKKNTGFKNGWTINNKFTTEDFFNFCFNNYHYLFENILSQIKKENIDFVGFSVFKGSRNFSLKTAQWLKENCPSIKIIFGGPEVFVMSLYGFIGFDYVDYFVIGEGEKALLNIIKGNVYEKSITFQPPEDINFYPKYGGFSLQNYPGKKRLAVQASRGCFNRCRFCSERLLYPSYRVRKAENVFEEIIYHYESGNADWFTFYDSIFNGDLNRLDYLLDLLIKKDIRISWDAQIAVRNNMPDELLKKMKKSGCVNLFIGLESGSDEVLTLMNKPFKSEEAALFLKRLKDSGLNFEVSLIAGYPGETEKNFQETMDFIKRNRDNIPKIAQVSLFRKYPGISYPGISFVKPSDYSEKKGLENIDRLLALFQELKIAYTPSYINNLI